MGLKTTFPDLPSHSTTLLCKVSKSYEIDLSSYLVQQCGDSCLINYASYLIGVVGTSLLISIQLSTDFSSCIFQSISKHKLTLVSPFSNVQVSKHSEDHCNRET